MTTTIEWTDVSWNPVTGCTEVSPGCDHCYARVMAERFRGSKAFPQGFDLMLHPERLVLPLQWKTPRKVFVNSMSDLFHKDVPDKFILQVFQVMRATPQHTYQILTKRPSRLVNTGLQEKIIYAHGSWPRNIWVGVSVESQAYTWRIDALRKVVADIRFISAEPLLGKLELDLHDIAWLITGAESGRGARPMNEDWVRTLRDQCLAQSVSFFYKQKLEKGRKVPLPMLDGRIWQEYPVVE